MTPKAAQARLAAAPWLRAADTQAVLALLDGAAGRTRAVGGIVRDTLVGIERAGAEIDFATELVPQEVLARAREAGHGAHPTGIAHGTVTLIVGALVAEITTLREDVETDGRHAVVRFGSDWRRDAERRDFTMNALYAGMEGTLFDPLGGLGDCVARRVRFIGDADRRIAEDRLRVYRFFRFSASHGGQRFDANGLAACQRAAGTLEALSAERVGAEMTRMMALEAWAATMQRMIEAGVLAGFDGDDVAAQRRYESLGAPVSLAGRLAVLAHEEGAVTVLKRRWRLSNALDRQAVLLLRAAALLNGGRLHEALRATGDADTVLAAVPVAAVHGGEDAQWCRTTESALRVAAEQMAKRPFPIHGRDLIAAGIGPGPEVGDALGRLFRQWVDSGLTLDRDALLERARGTRRHGGD